MAKPLVLTFGGTDIPFSLTKIDRSDLYGFVEIETLDEQGRKCTLATLADDGKSVIGSGGTALACLSTDGKWLEKKLLIPTDSQGKRITPVASSYAAPVPLQKTATIEEYLSHDIRSVYQISSETKFGPLMDELKKGAIYQFPLLLPRRIGAGCCVPSAIGGWNAVSSDWFPHQARICRPRTNRGHCRR